MDSCGPWARVSEAAGVRGGYPVRTVTGDAAQCREATASARVNPRPRPARPAPRAPPAPPLQYELLVPGTDFLVLLGLTGTYWYFLVHSGLIMSEMSQLTE